MYPEKELMLSGPISRPCDCASLRAAGDRFLVARAVKPLEAFDQAIATIRAMLPLLGIAALPSGSPWGAGFQPRDACWEGFFAGPRLFLSRSEALPPSAIRFHADGTPNA